MDVEPVQAHVGANSRSKISTLRLTEDQTVIPDIWPNVKTVSERG